MDRRRTAVVFLIVFSNFLGGTIVLPTLPLYAQRHFAMSPEVIAVLLDSYFIAQFVAAPFIGKLSDRFGRIPVLVISQIGTVLSFVMLGVAAIPSLLFGARILDGITGGNVIVVQAYIADVSPRKKRTEALSIVWMAFGLGYILGPAIGGLVAAVFNDETTFMLGAAVSLVSVLLTWWLLDESLTPERRRQIRQSAKRPSMGFRDVISNTPLTLILVIAFGVQLSLSMLTATFALFGEAVVFAGQTVNMVNLGVGLLLTCIGVGQFFTQLWVLKPLVARLGERWLVILGVLFRGLSMLAIAAFASPFMVGGAILVFAAASGLLMPSLNSLATTSVDEGQNGAVMGIYQSAISLGIIAGTYLGGDFFGIRPTLPYLVGGVLLVCIVIPSLMLRPEQQPVVVAQQ